MSHVPHEIPDEFPEFKDKIHTLKMTNGHFSRLFDEYHEVNREIHRVEAAGINMADPDFERLKLARLRLKDEIYHILHG